MTTRLPAVPGTARVGTELPPFSLELTLQRLVREAAVNRDFTPIHHDPVVAQRGGARTAYANTMLHQALVEAMLRNWAGPRARVVSISFAMRSFCYAGAVATARGEVTSVAREGNELLAVVHIKVESEGVTCVDGEAVVALPPGAGADSPEAAEA
jgi:acyl dehydratase